MAYNIISTAGSLLATVQDGAVDQSATSLTLIGKNYAGYGVFLNENYIKLLENFSNSTAPSNAITGQLWYDSANTLLKVRTSGGTWKPMGTASSSGTEPTGPITGDLWWDTTNGQLNVYSGSDWVLIGPLTTTGTGTSGPAVEIIADNVTPTPGNHVIVRFYVANSTVAIISKDATFTPGSAISGFATIKPGMNIASTNVISGCQFTGNASAADALTSGSGPLTASQFLRSDENETTTNTFGVLNNSGISIGASGSGNFNIGVVSGAVKLTNTVSNSDVNFYVNMGGIDTRAINVNGTTKAVTVDGALTVGGVGSVTGNLGITGWTNMTSAKVSTAFVPATTNTVDIGSSSLKFQTIYATTFSGNLSTSAPASMPSITKTGSNGAGDIGQTDNRFANVWATTFRGVSITAQYADLAERFEADVPMVPGTVVELGGMKEITAAVQELSEAVFGVISTLPGFLLNGAAGTDATHPAVAVNGRVPVRVIGKIKKGDRLVSAGNGIARAANRSEMTAFNVIGRALTDKNTDAEGTVEAIVKLNS